VTLTELIDLACDVPGIERKGRPSFPHEPFCAFSTFSLPFVFLIKLICANARPIRGRLAQKRNQSRDADRAGAPGTRCQTIPQIVLRRGGVACPLAQHDWLLEFPLKSKVTLFQRIFGQIFFSGS
jgi:hypothetical protein